MTTQAMTLSLEQQAKQRQSQPLEHHAQAQAPGAASLTPPPAIAPKPKKTPTPQKEPERDLELVGACLRVKSRGQAGGRAGVGQQAPGPQTWETWRGGCGKMQKRCCRAPAPRIRVGLLCEWQPVWQGSSFSFPSCRRRPHRRLKTGPGGPRASSRNGTISRSWVRALGVAIPHRNSATAPSWPGDGGVYSVPLGQCGLSRSPDGRARWRVIARAIWGIYRAAADQGGDDEASGQGEDPPGGGAGGGAGRRGTESRWWGAGWGGRLCGSAQGLTSFLSFWSVPSPHPPPVVKKPLTRDGAKAAQEAEAEPATEAGPGGGRRPAEGRAVVRSSNPEPRQAEPSREIRNIIRIYQSRPGPVPVPVQPPRCTPAVVGRGRTARTACCPEPPCGLLTSSFSQEAPPDLPEEKQP